MNILIMILVVITLFGVAVESFGGKVGWQVSEFMLLSRTRGKL